MKLKRVLSVHNMSDDFRGAQLTANMTGNQRISLLEKLRRDMAKACNYEYPERMKRVLTVIDMKDIGKKD